MAENSRPATTSTAVKGRIQLSLFVLDNVTFSSSSRTISVLVDWPLMSYIRHVITIFGLLLFGIAVMYSQYSQSYMLTGYSSMLNKITKGHRIPTEKVNMISGSKWIVVTSIQYPTEDVKNLASQKGFTLIVVADRKTPEDWNHTGVHFLSIEKQESIFGSFGVNLPYNSYTRKNLGYLYAIMNGAEWIYDTDDDNKPYGLGLNQFDYSETISGLCYAPVSGNLSEKLFNPYLFYGFKHMWPRGFPLEYLKGHTNGRDRMILCKELPRPAVQQGVVKADPDMDAIYRLLYAEKAKGLNITFNSVAPSILLNTGSYSPWNSQNTLFHYKAFFTMFLPTTVAFRVTDIWRSFFSQKLLHLIGENMAFYPMNAVQIRNAHDYLSDFHQEINVYDQSGKIVEFLDGWDCASNETASCVLELAEHFVQRNFFGQRDKELIEAWIEQLQEIGYKFPILAKVPVIIRATGVALDNCRAANFDMGSEIYEEQSELKWATQAVKGYADLLHWCKKADQNLQVVVPSADEFLQRYKANLPVARKSSTVLVLVNNYPWRGDSLKSVPLLQRMYSPFFKAVIFCGTWSHPINNPKDSQKRGVEDMAVLEPVNFVNITEDEMRGGAGYGYCLPKVRDLRLQNVSGYYFVADDSVFNIWFNLTVDHLVTSYYVHDHPGYWNQVAINKTVELAEKKYKNNTKIQKSWNLYMNKIQQKYKKVEPREHFLSVSRKILADFYYVPANYTDFFADLLELMVEAEVFVEVALGKIFDVLDFEMRHAQFWYLWYDGSRDRVLSLYNETHLGLHPLKMSLLHSSVEFRKSYCSVIIKAIGKHLYF